MSLLYCTYHLPIVGVVSAGVTVSPCVEVWQSGHGALEVILLHTAANSTMYPATRDDDGVLQLDGTCVAVINNNTDTQPHTSDAVLTLYSMPG